VDYSLTRVLVLTKDMHTKLLVGLAGYGVWQTTDNSGPGMNPRVPGLSRQRRRWCGEHLLAGEKSKLRRQAAQGILGLEHGARIFTSNHERHDVLALSLHNIAAIGN